MFHTDRKLDRRIHEVKNYRYRDVRELKEPCISLFSFKSLV